LLDEAGRVVRGGLAPRGTLGVGDHAVEWDGLSKRGQRVAGDLTVRVIAVSDAGKSELRTTVSVRKVGKTRR
jgi:hypothetical protein